MHIVPLKTNKPIDRRCKACGGHSPGADGGAHKVNGLITLGQPVAKKKPIYRSEDQSLRTPSRPGNDINMRWQQAMLANMRLGFRSSVDAEGPLG